MAAPVGRHLNTLRTTVYEWERPHSQRLPVSVSPRSRTGFGWRTNLRGNQQALEHRKGRHVRPEPLPLSDESSKAAMSSLAIGRFTESKVSART